MAGNESLSCREIQSLLNAGQYGRQALAHVQHCEICLQLFLDRVLPTREDASAPPLFAEQILVKLPPPSELRLGSLRVGLLIAASLIGASLIGVFFSELIAMTLSFWGSALLLAITVQVTFILLWLTGRTRV